MVIGQLEGFALGLKIIIPTQPVDDQPGAGFLVYRLEPVSQVTELAPHMRIVAIKLGPRLPFGQIIRPVASKHVLRAFAPALVTHYNPFQVTGPLNPLLVNVRPDGVQGQPCQLAQGQAVFWLWIC